MKTKQNKVVFLFVVTILFVSSKSISQGKVVFSEHFCDSTFNPLAEQLRPTKITGLGSYDETNEPYMFHIFSSRNDGVFSQYFVDISCPRDSVNKSLGFFAGIRVYHKEIPSDRVMLTGQLDSTMNTGKKYSFQCKVKFHEFAKYQVDSFQVLLVESRRDIEQWLAAKKFSGMYVNISLKDVDNASWKTKKEFFVPRGQYKYLVIGNLQDDDHTVIRKEDKCNCRKRPKGYWDTSELFIDDIVIKEEF